MKPLERHFIYVTARTLNQAQPKVLLEEFDKERTLLIFCSSFRVKRNAFPNLTHNRIPNAVLDCCEFVRDDYSMGIAKLAPLADVPAKDTVVDRNFI